MGSCLHSASSCEDRLTCHTSSTYPWLEPNLSNQIYYNSWSYEYSLLTSPKCFNASGAVCCLKGVLLREWAPMTRLWSFRRCCKIQPAGGQLWRLESLNERSNYISKLMILGKRSDRPFQNVNRMSKKTNIILVDFINLGPNFAS